MTKLVVIDPDGTVRKFAHMDLIAAADGVIGADRTSVITLGGYPGIPTEGPTLVGFIADFGATAGEPLNPKGWALYGRSPVHGTIVVGFDAADPANRPNLPDAFVKLLESPVADWDLTVDGEPVDMDALLRQAATTYSVAWTEQIA